MTYIAQQYRLLNVFMGNVFQSIFVLQKGGTKKGLGDIDVPHSFSKHDITELSSESLNNITFTIIRKYFRVANDRIFM